MSASKAKSTRHWWLVVAVVFVCALLIVLWVVSHDETSAIESSDGLARHAAGEVEAPPMVSRPAAPEAASPAESQARADGPQASGPVASTARLDVRVVDSSGAGTANAVVLAWPSVAAMGTDEPSEYLSDGNGWCSIDATDSTAIIATKPALGTSLCALRPSASSQQRRDARPNDQVPGSRAPQGMTLHLLNSGRVHGIVRDRDGKPVAGAHVVIGDDPPADVTVPVVLEPFEYLPPRGGIETRLPRVLLSDAGGRFDFGMDLDWGGSIYAVVGVSRTPAVQTFITKGEDHEVELRLLGGLSIMGVLIGPPTLSKARVWAYNKKDLVEIDGSIDSQGSYRIEVAKPGDYTVFAVVPSFAQDEPVVASLTGTESLVHVDVRLSPVGVLFGTIRLASGKPFENRSVMLTRLDADGRRGGAWSGAGRPSTRTDSEGSFRFEGVHPTAEAVLELGARCRPSTFRHVRADRSPVDLLVEERDFGELTLSVTDANTGAPVTDFEYEAPGNCDWRRVSASDGRTRVALQSPDREILINLRADSYAVGQSAPFRMTAAPTEIELRLGRHGGLGVSLMNEHGKPCVGAKATLFPEGMLSVWVANDSIEVTTDETGGATFEALPPGRYWLACSRGEQRLGPVSVVVPSGRSDPLSLVMPASQDLGAITARMSADPSDGSNPEFAVRQAALVSHFATDEERRQPASAVTDTHFSSLPPGVYWIALLRDGDDVESACVVVQPSQRVSVVLDP